MRRNGGLIGSLQTIKANNPEKVRISDLYDVHNSRLTDDYPISINISSYAVTATHSGGDLTLNNSNWVQNEVMTVVVNTNTANRNIYWSVGTGSGGTNFFSTNPSSGSFTTAANGIGSFKLTTDLVGFSQTSDETVDLIFKESSNSDAIYTITATIKAPVWAGNSTNVNEGLTNTSFIPRIDYIGHNGHGGDATSDQAFYARFVNYTLNGSNIGSSSPDISSEITSTTFNYTWAGINENTVQRGVRYIDGVSIVADLITEGTETIRQYWGITLPAGATSGVTVNSTSSTYAELIIADTSTTPNFTTNTASATTIAEGSSVQFTVRDPNLSSGTIYWTIEGSASTSDITPSSGSFSLSTFESNIGVTAIADSNTSESTENFRLQYRTGSTSGTIVATSPYVNITNVVPDISNSFVAAVPSGTFSYTSSSDSTLAYNVFDFNVPSGASGSKRIYIGLKCTHPTTYRNDACFAGLQILNSAGTAIQRADIFSVGTESYETVTARIRNSSSIGFAPISTATSASYTAIANGSSARRFNRASGTGSTYTGMADGISTAYNSSAILPAPSNTTIYQVNQSGGTYYHYVETSGVSRYDEYTMRSPAYNFSGGEIIRLCAQLSSNSGFDIDNTIFLAIA